jgi:hypothetical protein
MTTYEQSSERSQYEPQPLSAIKRRQGLARVAEARRALESGLVEGENDE